MTTSEAVNGQNIYTGTVHKAHRDGAHLVQNCGVNSNMITGQRASLVETTAQVTCKRCAAQAAKKVVTRQAPKAAASTGPTTWGVFGADGKLRTWDLTKRGALAKAEKIGAKGLTVRKV